MNNIEFLHPNIFYFTILFLVFLLFWFIYQKKQDKKYNSAISIPFLDDLKQAQKNIGIIKSKKIFIWLKWIFFIISIILLSIALARPQKISSENKITKNGVDILIALDVSESMLAEDLKPNRIESAKKYIGNFVSNLKSDRIGLEIFAGKTFTQSPMSFDYNVVKYYLSEISTDNINQRLMGLGGTAIGDAILSGINRFKNSPERTKVMVLLTDGETNIGADPIFSAEQARTSRIKIYTIGLGRKEGAKIPIKTLSSGKKIYAKNRDGTYFKSSFDEQALKDIAKVSGGKYFWAGNNDALKKSLDTINKLEKKEYEAEIVTKRRDLFWNWLFYGFLSALLSTFFTLFTQEIKIKKIINTK